MSNSKTVIKNSMIGMIAQLCSMLISFISQKFYLNYLGLEVLGLNSVIGETLAMLAFAELGVGTAISYRLYKPLVSGDKQALADLMELYRTLYKFIGAVVFVFGIGLMFFLPVIIKETTFDLPYIRSAYLIQLCSTTSTYFFAYKRSLIYVDQKQFVCKIADISCSISYTILRMITLFFFGNFHLYLCLQFAQVVTANVILAVYYNKHYSDINGGRKSTFEDIKGIFKDTKNVLMGKICGYIYSSTDNLVITRFAGLTLAGGFSNYKFVTNSVKNLVYSMTDSIMATIGNSIQVKNPDESFELFKKYSFIRYVVANISITGLIICADAFVGFAYGSQYIMDESVLILIAIDIFIGIVYGPLGEYINVLGYFAYDKYISFVGAIVNITLSIIFVQKIGVQGVLVGTVVAQVFFWISKSILLCNKYFKSYKYLLEMWKRYLSYVAVFLIQIFALRKMKYFLFYNNYTFVSFLIEGMISVAFAICLLSLFFFRTSEYKYLVGIVRKMINRGKKNAG